MPTFSSVSAGRKHWRPDDVPRLGIPAWREDLMGENALAQMKDGEKRDRILGEFNASTLDSVGPVAVDLGMKVLEEMNELGERQKQNHRKGFQRSMCCSLPTPD
jgi:hypothetical protein